MWIFLLNSEIYWSVILKYDPTEELTDVSFLCGLVYHWFDKCKENENVEIFLKEEMSVINLIIKSTK